MYSAATCDYFSQDSMFYSTAAPFWLCIHDNNRQEEASVISAPLWERRETCEATFREKWAQADYSLKKMILEKMIRQHRSFCFRNKQKPESACSCFPAPTRWFTSTSVQAHMTCEDLVKEFNKKGIKCMFWWNASSHYTDNVQRETCRGLMDSFVMVPPQSAEDQHQQNQWACGGPGGPLSWLSSRERKWRGWTYTGTLGPKSKKSRILWCHSEVDLWPFGPLSFGSFYPVGHLCEILS